MHSSTTITLVSLAAPSSHYRMKITASLFTKCSTSAMIHRAFTHPSLYRYFHHHHHRHHHHHYYHSPIKPLSRHTNQQQQQQKCAYHSNNCGTHDQRYGSSSRHREEYEEGEEYDQNKVYKLYYPGDTSSNHSSSSTSTWTTNHNQNNNNNLRNRETMKINSKPRMESKAKAKLLLQFHTDSKTALRVLEEVSNRGELDVSDCDDILNEVFLICAHQKNEIGLFAVLELMKRYCGPESITLDHMNALMQVFSDGEKIISLFRSLIESDRMKPNEQTLRIMLQGADNTHMYREAIHLFNTVVERHLIYPCVASYTMVIGMYAKEGQMQDALKALIDMQIGGVMPSAVTYSTLIKGFLDYSKGRIRTTDPLPSWERRKKIDGAEFLTFTLIESWIQLCGLSNPPMLRIALDLFNLQHKTYQLNGDEDVAPDVYEYNIFMDGLVKDKRYKQVDELVDVMKENNVRMDQTTVNILLKCYLDQDKVHKAEKLIQNRRLKVDVCTFNTLMTYQLKRFKNKRSTGTEAITTMLRYFKELTLQNSLLPDTVTCSLLIEAYCLIGKPNNAYRIYQQMRNVDKENYSQEDDEFMVQLPCKVQCNAVTYELLMHYLRRHAKQLFITMIHEDNIMPSETVMNTMSRVLKIEDVYSLWDAVRKKYSGLRPTAKTLAIIYVRNVGTLESIQERLNMQHPITRASLLKYLFEKSTDQMIMYVLRIMNSEGELSQEEYQIIICNYAAKQKIVNATKYWDRLMSGSTTILPTQQMIEAIIDVWTLPDWKNKLSDQDIFMYLKKAFQLNGALGGGSSRGSPRLRNLQVTENITMCLYRAVLIYPKIVLTNKFTGSNRFQEDTNTKPGVIEVVRFGQKKPDSPSHTADNVPIQYLSTRSTSSR